MIKSYMNFLFILMLLLLPALAKSAGSNGGSCKALFHPSTNFINLDSVLIAEIEKFGASHGTIKNFSQVMKISNQVLARLKELKEFRDEEIYKPSSSEAFLLNKIERYLIRDGIKGLLSDKASPIRTSRLWQKMQEYKESQGNGMNAFLSVLYLEPVYKSIIMHSLKVVDEYIIPFANKNKVSVPFQFLNLEKAPNDLLHSIVMEGISKEKVQKLHELFGNGVYAEYNTSVVLKYISRLNWMIIIAMILDELHDQMKEHKAYAFLSDYYSLGKNHLIDNMVEMDQMMGDESNSSYYLGLNPLELLKEYQDHY